MKRQLLSALVLTIATTTIPSTAIASSVSSGDTLHRTRLDYIDSRSKSIDRIQPVRLEDLGYRSKTVENVHEIQLEQLNRRMSFVVIAIALRLLHPLLLSLSRNGVTFSRTVTNPAGLQNRA